MESETAKLAACMYKNGSANVDNHAAEENGSADVNNHAAEENKLENAKSFLPTLLQEVMQGASDRGTQSQLLENAQDLMVTKQDSNDCQSCANLKPADEDIASQPSDTGPSVWPTDTSDTGPSVWLTDTSNAATSRENTAGNVGENAIRGFTEALNSLEQTDQMVSGHKNVEYGLNMDSTGLHEAHASSQTPDTYSNSLIENNTRFSHSSTEVTVPPTENGVYLRNNIFDGESEVLRPHTSMGASETFRVSEEKFTDLSNQETGVVVVSTDLHGWQRFDVEENEVDGLFGHHQATDGKSQQKRELWEQLLEEGSEDNDAHFQMSTSQVEAETGIDASLHDGNQFWLASPGNPFIEGLDRLSNFSEADDFTANENIARSQLLHSFEADACLPFKEEAFHTDHSSNNFLQDKLVEGNLASQSNVLYEHGSRRHGKPRFPSFSDIRGTSFSNIRGTSSSKSRDPSFGSFMEQVPAFQAGNHVHGIESSGEKWEANFDLMVPATQEGPRSLSLPREVGDNTQAQRQKGTFSLFSRESPSTSQSKPSGFLSPKLSPIVKKVVNKVWTKPEQVARHGESSNTKDNEEPKRWRWRCCICCSHAK